MNFKIYPNMTAERITSIAIQVTESYMDGEITKEEGEIIFNTIFYPNERNRKNRLRIRKNGKYTTTFKKGMGAKRLQVFEQLFQFRK